ncbi:sugar ABC transporter permease, partial [Staphylococcus sp. SIMBA_130]
MIALLLNQLRNQRYKKFVQTVIYAPHFISVVVLVGMVYVFFSPNGLINNFLMIFGAEPVHFMSQAGWFKPL